MGGPERQCIGCGRRAPQNELVRLCVAERGETKRVEVSRGRKRQGRGAYLCGREVCLERALMRRAFQRAFRISVEVDKDELARATEDSRNGPAGGRT